MLKADTVGDVLRAQTNKAAHVVAISLKDRSAVIPGGHDADMAAWYDRVHGVFTTSSYYAPTLPTWIADFNAHHPASSYFAQPWVPLAP